MAPDASITAGGGIASGPRSRASVGQESARAGADAPPPAGLDELAAYVHAAGRAKGFWDHEDGNPSIDGEKIALMHSELSEALDALRDGDMEHVAEELADTIIRILDYTAARGLSMDQAIAAKIEKNRDRPRLHGRQW